ncbi:hypothetical protein D3C72_1990060 [compost metagenome]
MFFVFLAGFLIMDSCDQLLAFGILISIFQTQTTFRADQVVTSSSGRAKADCESSKAGFGITQSHGHHLIDFAETSVFIALGHGEDLNGLIAEEIS